MKKESRLLNPKRSKRFPNKVIKNVSRKMKCVQAFFSKIVKLAESGNGTKTPRSGKRQVSNKYLIKMVFCPQSEDVFKIM